jgi:hypothetical protein
MFEQYCLLLVGIGIAQSVTGRAAGVRFPTGERFSLLHSVQTGSGAQPASNPIQWVPGILFRGVKQPGRETNHSLSSSAKVKDCGAISPLP